MEATGPLIKADINFFYSVKSIESVLTGLGTSGRVKYSCVDVGISLVVFGANTGSVYFFDRASLNFLKLFSSPELQEGLTLLKLSPAERFLAVVVGKSTIYVAEMALKSKERIVVKVTDHKDAEVTAIHWTDPYTLVSADDAGAVYLSYIPRASKLFFQAELLYRTDSRVVQLDSLDSRLAVSSLTRCVILDLAKKTSQVVGTKLRDGRFGACFHSGAGANVVFAARPGKRVWVAESTSGKVLSTLSFTSAIAAAAASNFSKLLPLANALLATDESTAAFVLDVNTVETLAEFPLQGPIYAIASWDSEAYVLHGPTRSVSRLIAENPHITARRLLERGDLQQAVDISLKFRNTKVQHPEAVELLKTLVERASLAAMPAERITALQSLLSEAQLHLEEYRAQQLLEEQRRKQKEEEDRAEQLRLQQQRQSEEEEQRAALMDRLRNAPPRPSSPTPHPQFSVPFLPATSDIIAAVPGASVLSTSQMAPSIPIEGSGSATSTAISLRGSGVALNAALDPAGGANDSAADSKKRPKVRKMRTIDFNSSAAPVITTTTKLLPTPVSAPSSVPPPPTAAASTPSQVASGSDTEPESTAPPPPAVTPPAPLRTSGSSPLTTSFGGTSPAGAGQAAAAAVPSALSFLDSLPVDTLSPATPPLPASAMSPTSAAIQAKPPAAPPVPLAHSPSSGSSSVGGTPRQNESTSPQTRSRPVSPPPVAPAPTGGAQPPQLSRPISPQPAPRHSRGPSVDIRTGENPAPFSRATSLVNVSEPPKLAPGPTTAPSTASVVAAAATSTAASSAWSLAKKMMGNIAGATAVVPPALKQSLSLDDLRTTTPPTSTPTQPDLVAPGEADPLTRAAHEALQRSQKSGGSIAALKTLLTHWLAGFDPARSPPYTPQLWLQDILTALFEINAMERWSSESAFEFLSKYGAFVYAPTAALICNEQHWNRCLQFLMERENKELDSQCVHVEKILITPPNESGGGGARVALEHLRVRRNLLLTLKFLKRLLQISPKETVAYCVSAYPLVQPWNVDEARAQDSSGLQLYLEYIEQLMASHEEPRGDSALVSKWFGYCLQDGSPDRELLFDSEGFPRKDAHKATWRHVSTLRNILANPRTYRYNKSELLEKCQSVGFFAGLLLLLPRTADSPLLELSMRLDDLLFFRQFASEVEQPQRWQSVMLLAVQLRQHFPSISRAITKEEIIASMAIALGAVNTVQLLLTSQEFVSDVDARVYGSLLVSFRAAKKEQKLVHDMLELIDSYLWAQKPLATAPQIRALREAEINDLRLSTLSFVDSQQLLASSSPQSSEPMLKFDYGGGGNPLPRHFLEYRSHWGVAVDLLNGSCPACTLSFTDGSAGELSIFPCGHAFHQACASEEACKLCYDSQLNAQPLYHVQSE